MHSHETCEQLMAAANRSGNYGRLDYLSRRCDMTHGREAADRAAHTAPAPTIAEPKRLGDPHERDPKVQAARDEIGARTSDSNQEMSA